MTRIQRLREKMAAAAHGKHRIALPSTWSTRDAPGSLPERKALALNLVLENMPIFIDEDELIVGSRTVYGERSADSGYGWFAYPTYAADQEKAVVGGQEGTSKGHVVGGYRRVLEHGFGGIAQAAATKSQETDSPTQRSFYRSVETVYTGATNLALRYADLADEQAGTAVGPRKDELVTISQACRHVAYHPPRNFHEALQLYWFTHLILMAENFYGVCFGRFDQTMLSFYQGTPEAKAMELLSCFFIKLNDPGDTGEGNPHAGSDNLVLSGYRPDGTDGTNELTYACLAVVDELRLPNPQIAIRLHSASPKRYVEESVRLACQGLNNLAFYNDDTIIPGLHQCGFPLEDARDYALDLCQDVLIEGKSDFFLGGQVSLTHVLLDTIQDADAATFPELLEQYKSRIRDGVKRSVDYYNEYERACLMAGEDWDGFLAATESGTLCVSTMGTHPLSPLPFLSGGLDDCLTVGKDIVHGGLRYLDKGFFFISPVNAVNSLAAIREVVYEQQIVSLGALKTACDQNFADHDRLRSLLLAAPKWGNDDDRVDLLAKEVFEYSCREVTKHRTYSNARFVPGIHQPHSVGAGKNLQATPDGRLAGEPIPVTLSPTNGTEKRGPTAVIRSVTKIDPLLSPWNSALTLTLPCHVVQGSGEEKFQNMLLTFMQLGGIELQTNVVNTEHLRAAQQDPDQYRHIIVRIWGMSAFFVDISRELQDEIIARTEHEL